MKLILSLFALVMSARSFAADPPAIGNFEGLAFTSPTSRHPFTAHGGNLSACETSGPDLTTCQVQGAYVEVSGPPENALRVDLTKVVAYRYTGKDSAGWYYYMKGTTNLVVGPKSVSLPVSVTLGVVDGKTDSVTGSVILKDQDVRTNLEGFRVQ